MKIFFFIIGLSFINFSEAQVWTNPITGTNPNNSNPYTTGQTVAAHLTVSGIGRGSGIGGSDASNRYEADGWNESTSMGLNDYFSFTLTPTINYWINLSSLEYHSQIGSGGPGSFAVRSSLDNFSSNLGSPFATGDTITLGSPSFIHLTAPITFRIYGWHSTGGNYSINDFTFNGELALPIQLSSFDVIFNKNPILQWTTMSELNNSYFSIERSSNGSDFIEIDKIKGQGTSDKQNEYTYTDLSSNKGINYYRLKGVDLDGRFTYCPIKSVFVPVDYFTVYPTIFDQAVTVQFLRTEEKSIKWFLQDAFGKTVKSGQILQSKWTQKLSLYDTYPGVYFLIIGSDKGLKSQKLIKL